MSDQSKQLFDALNKDDLQTVEQCLASSERPNLNEFNENTFPMLEALLKGGADVNLPNQAGFTPIQVALQSGWQDTFAFLFQCAGAKFDPDMRAATNVRCPDCLRAIAVYEANGYKPEGYVFSNSKYNNYKISA